MSTVTHTPGSVLRLTCPCDLAAVREVARTVRSFLERQGLPVFEIDGWELVCTEGGNNAVEHVHPPSIELPLEFIIEVSPSSVELRIVDHTDGFDLPSQAALPENPLDEGGRGLFLIRILSDSVRYWRGETENCLVVRRERATVGKPQENSEASIHHALLESTLHTMTEELAASYESLSAIFRFTEELHASNSDTTFLDRWLRELRHITGADWYVLRLVNEPGTELRVAETSHPNLQLPPLPLRPGNGVPAPLEVAAALDRNDVWFDAALPPDPSDPLHRLAPPLAGLAHPLFVSGDLVGVLAVGRYARAHAFTASQVNIIHTLGDFFALQLRNAEHDRSRLQNQLLERDFEVAAHIQRQLLPGHHPRRGRWVTQGFCESADRVAGDFYDVLGVGSHGLLLAIADVMGKGLPAALFAMVFRTLLHARPDLARSPSAFVEWLNHNLIEELGGLDMIITAQIAYINLQTRELRVAGAGHPPLLIVSPDHPPEQVFSSGPPLGIDADLGFFEERRILPEGARVLLYTDGLTEATDEHGVSIGTQPLLDILRDSALHNLDAEATLARCAALPSSAHRDRTTSDDRTVLLLLEDLSRTATPANH